MTPRQAKADAIARALRKSFGEDAQVISALPLDSGQQLRIRVIDSKRHAFIEKMCEWHWIPSHVCATSHVSTHGGYGLIPASVFEVKIEEERPVIPDRKIYGEVEERKKTDAEVRATMKALGRWS